MSEDRELQRDFTRLVLQALDGTDFALAGSGAVREHGLVDRRTNDIDLFTSDIDVERFGAAVTRVTEELERLGHEVVELRRAPQFAKLRVTTRAGAAVEMDFGVDWRKSPPVTLEVGPVLTLEDAVGNKVLALFGRGEARDFLDVDAFRQSGRFTDADLLRAAADRDDGFSIPMFAEALDRVQRVEIGQVAGYDVDVATLGAIKERFASWAGQLRTPQLDPD